MIIIKSKRNQRELEEQLLALLSRENIDAEHFSFSTQYCFTFPGLTIDGGSQQAICDGTPIPLTRIEFDLLFFLAAHLGQTLSKEEIFHAVWGRNNKDTLKVVANTISNLRKKLAPHSASTYIRTVRGGYTFATEGTAR